MDTKGDEPKVSKMTTQTAYLKKTSDMMDKKDDEPNAPKMINETAYLKKTSDLMDTKDDEPSTPIMTNETAKKPKKRTVKKKVSEDAILKVFQSLSDKMDHNNVQVMKLDE